MLRGTIGSSALRCCSAFRTLRRPNKGGGHARPAIWLQNCADSTGVSTRMSRLNCTATTETDVQSGGLTKPQSVISILRERGLVESVTSEDFEEASLAQSFAVYCGFDPTADSLHLGNLLGIIVLSWFQRCGHSPIALIGGATGRVGDPSGKSTERPVLSEEAIEHNIKGIESVLQNIFEKNSSPGAAPLRVMNNLEWFGGMNFLSFLRDVGKHARVGTMLAKESVKTRLASESGISFTEFTYQLLQGYDFFHLCRSEGVRVQIGGSDQWGNITAGTELVRKLWHDDDVPTPYGLTFPLLLDSEGRKFGKSEGGAVWLSPDKVSPYKLYQNMFATTDADVVRFIKMLTFLPMEEIRTLEESAADADYVPNTLQRCLAEEVTRFVHGEDGLQQALKITRALQPGADTTLDGDILEEIAEGAPSASLPRNQVVDTPLVDIMVAVNMQPSKGAVRRLMKGGGVRLNNVQIKDESFMVGEQQIIDGSLLLLATGKKNKLLLRLT